MNKRIPLSEKVAEARRAMEEASGAVPTPANVAIRVPAAHGASARGGFMGKVLRQGNEGLEAENARLKSHGHEPLIDSKLIRPSKFANRAEAAFADSAFKALKASIQHTNGNEQAIKVRPAEPGADGTIYEIVFGHRRHRACLELGLPVKAIIKDVPDALLPLEMHRENTERNDISNFELGCFVLKLIDAGLFESERDLARELKVSQTKINRAKRIASLPQEVIGVFADPRRIEGHSAQQLAAELASNHAAVLDRAKKLKQSTRTYTAMETIRFLLGISAPRRSEKEPVVDAFGAELALWRTVDGKDVLEFRSAISPDTRRRIEDVLKNETSAP